MERISTGINGLDAKLSGGYPKGKSILITGSPGTGKTIFGLHLLHKSCNAGMKCVLMATEESPEDIFVQGKMIGFDFEEYCDTGQLVIERILEKRTESTEKSSYMGVGFEIAEEGILEQVKRIADDVDIVIIDNIGVFALDLSIKDFRDQIDTINRILTTKNCTTLYIMDETAYELTHKLAEYAAYGSIKLMVKENPYTGKRERYMDIPKMRSTELTLELYMYKITSDGIKFQKSSDN